MVLSLLHCDGNRIKDASDNIVILRGVNWDFARWMDRNDIADQIGYIKAMGCNAVWIGVWGPSWGGYPNIYSNDTFWSKLDTIMSECATQELYVIFRGFVPAGVFDVTTAFVVSTMTTVADRYSAYNHIIYEPVTEANMISYSEYSTMMQDTIDAIRVHRADAIVSVGCMSSGLWTDFGLNFQQQYPIGRTNICFSLDPYGFHIYPDNSVAGIRWLLEANDLYWALENGFPVIMSEFSGMDEGTYGTWDYTFNLNFMTTCDADGFSGYGAWRWYPNDDNEVQAMITSAWDGTLTDYGTDISTYYLAHSSETPVSPNLFEEDWETGGYTSWADGLDLQDAGSTVTIQSTVKQAGTYASKHIIADVDNAVASVGHHFSDSYTSMYTKLHVRLSALPAEGDVLMVAYFFDYNYAVLTACLLLTRSSGVLKWGIRYASNSEAINVAWSAAQTVAVDTWYELELGVVHGASGAGELHVWFTDGTTAILDVTSVSNDNYESFAPYFGAVNLTNSYAVTVYIDNIYVDTGFIDFTSTTTTTHTLTITAVDLVTTDPVEDTYTYDTGTLVTVVATPNTGYEIKSALWQMAGQSDYTVPLIPWSDGLTRFIFEITGDTTLTFYPVANAYVSGWQIDYWDATSELWVTLDATYDGRVHERCGEESYKFSVTNTSANRTALGFVRGATAMVAVRFLYHGTLVYSGVCVSAVMSPDSLRCTVKNAGFIALKQAPNTVSKTFGAVNVSLGYIIMELLEAAGVSSTVGSSILPYTDPLGGSLTVENMNAFDVFVQIAENFGLDYYSTGLPMGIRVGIGTLTATARTEKSYNSVSYNAELYEGASNNFDKSLIVGRVTVRGTDVSTGNVIIGTAGTSGATKNFVYTKPTTASVLNTIATKKLLRLNNPCQGVTLPFLTNDIYTWMPGNYLLIDRPDLGLPKYPDGPLAGYIIQRITDDGSLSQVEVDVKADDSEQYLKELVGITQDIAVR